jgi:hypothetical protein
MNIPAFPSKDEGGYYDGMTLRDYFAGQALIGLFAGGKHFMFTSGDAAKRAYDMANAMLEARGQSK